MNFCDFDYWELETVKNHSAVGTILYQDIKDSSVYYLGIYDSNYPGY